MTIFLVLGLFAGLYLLWLLFSLAIYALPVAAGITFAFWMRDHDYGYFAAIPAGIAGYHAVKGVIGLAIDPGMMLSTLSWIGSVTIAVTAWIRLASLEISQPAQAAAGAPATTAR